MQNSHIHKNRNIYKKIFYLVILSKEVDKAYKMHNIGCYMQTYSL